MVNSQCNNVVAIHLRVVWFDRRNYKPGPNVPGCRSHRDVAQGMLNAVLGLSLDHASWYQLV